MTTRRFGLCVALVYYVCLYNVAQSSPVETVTEEPKPSPTSPTQCGPNEVFEQCKITCPPPTCESLGENIACFAPNDCSKGGCNCKEGYTRNGTLDDPCIPVNQCPKKPEMTCPTDEVYFKCTLVKCYKTCTNLLQPMACPSIVAGCFQPGCLCKDDWLRNKDGKCVSWKQCPK